MTVTLCRPTEFLRRRYRRCPTCQCQTEMVLIFTAWYDTVMLCSRCGDGWGADGRFDRPLSRYWRRDAVAAIRRLWDRATYGPPPTFAELFPEDMAPE